MPLHRWAPFGATASIVSLLLSPIAVRAEQAPVGTHVVQQGETLSQIADEAGVDVTALATLNGLDDANVLAVGQSLKVPSTPAAPIVAAPIAQAAPMLAAPVTPAATATTGRRSLLVPYTVQAGETLNQIARKFSVRADAIVQASGLDDANKLSIGTVLKVPLPAKEHVVADGETLRDIAAAEKVDLGSLIDFNQLDDPALIHVGDVVLVPAPATQQAASAGPSRAPDNEAPRARSASDVDAQHGPSGRNEESPRAGPPARDGDSAPAATTSAAQAATPTATAKPAAPAPMPTATPAPAQASASTATATATAAGPTPKPQPAAPAPAVAPPPSASGDALAAAAQKLLGSPYVWGGSSPSGFDCSGLVWYVAKQVGKTVSRGMLGQYNAGPHPAREELKPGDLVFFQNTYTAGLSHNGIYIGNGQFVDATDEHVGVAISNLNSSYWSSHWFGATRLA
jgi:peptidoglycan DL-endopeptidase LytE